MGHIPFIAAGRAWQKLERLIRFIQQYLKVRSYVEQALRRIGPVMS